MAKKIKKNEQTQSHNHLNIIEGDVLKILPSLPNSYYQSCITSPPYWGLRDYSVQGQIGAEMELNEYLNKMVEVFRGIRKLLKDDGTLWLNIGDGYTSGGRTWRAPDSKNPARGMSYRAPTPKNLKPKDLIGVPWRVAFALQDDGWFLRSDIIWNKPNCQPESVRDRPTRSHEYLFLFTKNEKYYYDYEAIKEQGESGLKNRRTVWQINTEPYKGAHFAVFPKKLVELCILAGTKPNDIVIDPFFGSGTVGLVANKLQRDFTGIELNPEYINLAKERVMTSLPLLAQGK